MVGDQLLVLPMASLVLLGAMLLSALVITAGMPGIERAATVPVALHPPGLNQPLQRLRSLCHPAKTVLSPTVSHNQCLTTLSKQSLPPQASTLRRRQEG